jgi:Fe-S-cluster containining protein
MVQLRQFIPKDYCLSCQGCCRFAQNDSVWLPQLLEEEKNRLGKLRVILDQEQGNFICGFLNKENNKCKVYRLRPFDCQLYPFIFHRQNNKVFLAADLKCIFLKENFPSQEFKDYARRLIELIKTPSFLNILKSNPGLIQTYIGAAPIEEFTI